MCDYSTEESVSDYYGQTIQCVEDFKVKVCSYDKCRRNKWIAEAEKQIHPKVKERYYGCGVIAPDDLQGLRVLDLGSGAGMDCFVLSKGVGETGFVTGVDITEELLEFAEEYRDYHREKFGYAKSNVEFVKGTIEDLTSAGVEDNSQDVVISNCVISLVANKKAVLKEAYRVLQAGGEFYFSDMYSNKPVPEELKGDKEMWGEGLTYALSWPELVEQARDIGFSTPLLVETTQLAIEDTRMKTAVDQHGLQYISATYRLFKCSEDESRRPCADYLQVTYGGEVPGQPDVYTLARDFIFKTNIPTYAPCELWSILCQSRLAKYFKVTQKHIGVSPFMKD